MASLRLSDTPTSDLLRGGPVGAQNAQLLDAARQGPRPAPAPNTVDVSGRQKPAVDPATGVRAVPNTVQATTTAATPNPLAQTYRAAVGRDLGFAGPQPRPSLRGAAVGAIPTIAGGVDAAITEVPKVMEVARRGNDLDTATQASEATAKIAAGAAGAGIGTKLGAVAGSVFGPLGTFGGAALGGLAGGWLGPKLAGSAIDTGRRMLDTEGPALGPAPAATSTTPARPTNFRGNGFDDPRLINRDPSRGSLGPSRDFTNELATVPRELPGDLRSGVIYKTLDANGRPVYSGRDVGAGAQFVDGKGATIGSRGTFNTMPGMSKDQIAEIMARPSNFNPNMTAEQNLQYNREVADAQARNAAGAIIDARSNRGPNLMSPEYQAQRRLRMDMQQGLGESNLQYQQRMKAMMEGREQDFREKQSLRSDGTARRGQDLDYDMGLRRDSTARYAADSGMRTKQVEVQANQRLRDAVGDIYKRNTGKDGEVNQIGVQQDLMRMGLTDQAKAVTDSIKGVQEITSKQDDLGKGGFERVLRNAPVSSYKNEKGETVYDKDGTANRVRTILQNRPELSNLSDTELRKVLPDLLAEQGVLEAVNRATQEQSGLGFRGDILPSANPSQTQFQQRVPGSFLRNMDMSGEGFFNWIGAEGGDVTLRSGDTWESTYNLGKLNDYERAYLQRRIEKAKEGK